jgi:hypothetical protein
MTGKIQKLTELSELLKNGAITSQEFEVLKNEILTEKVGGQKTDVDSLNLSTDIDSNQSSSSVRKKILLKSYPLKDGSFVEAPEIQFLDMSYITSDERRVLKSFLSKKQLAAPEELTQDEIEISNKIFTKRELDGFYKKNNSQVLVKGLVWLILLVAITASGNLLYNENVFRIKDKISELFSDDGENESKVDVSSKDEVDENAQFENNKTNECTICGYDFKGNGYEEISDGVWERCNEPYQCYICSPACGRKHTQKMNSYLKGGSSNERIQGETCSLCRGTGIESGWDPVTHEKTGRVCPMCNGKGRVSY